MTTTTSHTTSFELRPISAADAERLRRLGGTVHVADATPGYPCRQCLRDAEIGEELILTSYDPFHADSPYRSASPIFLHRESCDAPTLDGGLPAQITGRQLSVRSFDADEMMIDATVIDGLDLADAIERFFADGDSDKLHVHFAQRGCFAVDIERRG